MHTARARRSAVIRPAATTLLGSIALATVLVACDEPERPVAPAGPDGPTGPIEPRLTLGSGTTRTFLGQGTHQEFDKVRRRDDGWRVAVNAKGGLEVLVQSFAYEPDAQTGWHRHPGPVFIQVLEGTLTFYEVDGRRCRAIVVHAGQG